VFCTTVATPAVKPPNINGSKDANGKIPPSLFSFSNFLISCILSLDI